MSKGKPVEFSEARFSLDLLDFKLNLLVSILGVILHVSQVKLADTVLKTLSLNLRTLSFGDASPSNHTLGFQVGRRLNVIPDFFQEGVHLLLLLPLLTGLVQPLVLALRHLVWSGVAV